MDALGLKKAVFIGNSAGANIALQASPLLLMFFNLEELYQEYTSLTDESRAQISKSFAENFQLPNDRAEKIIEKIFTIILSLEDVVQELTQK